MATELEQKIEKHADALLKELHAEMRAISDAELKMLPFFFAVATIVLTGNLLTLLNKPPLSMVLGVSIPSFLLIAAFWWQLHNRLTKGHDKYRHLGEKVREVWRILEVADFCKPPEGYPELGEGRGYRKSQLLIASLALPLLLVIGFNTVMKIATFFALTSR